jgi:hypothetical protein
VNSNLLQHSPEIPGVVNNIMEKKFGCGKAIYEIILVAAFCIDKLP